MEKIAKLICASGEGSADMLYAAGFSTPDEFLWFDPGRNPAIILSSLEYSRGKSSARPGVSVLLQSEFAPDARRQSDVILEIARKYKLTGFVVPEQFPFGLADVLQHKGLQIRPVQGAFFPEREFKSDAELQKITLSLRAAEAGLARAVEVLRESRINAKRQLIWKRKLLTSEILRWEIDRTMLELGMLPTGTICAGGVQGAQPHNTGSGVLLADHPIVMDIFPRSQSTGYWGDLTRTVVKGTPSPVMCRAYEAVSGARTLCESLIQVGADSAMIHNRAAEFLEAAGFPTGCGEKGNFGFFHGLGHGVGLDIHEMPRLSPRCSRPLKGGEVVTVEPGLYYPEWGGIRIEDLIYVSPATGKGVVLTEAPDFFVID